MPLPEDDPKVRQPDISRARKLLDWEPKVFLDDGLERTYQYFKTELTDRFRSPHLWKKTGSEWKLRHTVNNDGVDD